MRSIEGLARSGPFLSAAGLNGRWELVNLAGEQPPLPAGAAEKMETILREAEARGPNR